MLSSPILGFNFLSVNHFNQFLIFWPHHHNPSINNPAFLVSLIFLHLQIEFNNFSLVFFFCSSICCLSDIQSASTLVTSFIIFSLSKNKRWKSPLSICTFTFGSLSSSALILLHYFVLNTSLPNLLFVL